MNFRDKGRAWLAQQRATHNSRKVTYRRGEQTIEDLVVSVGQSQAANLNPMSIEPTQMDMLMLSPEAANRDYVVTAADLGDLWPPASGDLIDDPNDAAAVYRFKLMSLPGGAGVWRWLAGGYQKQARLHAKFVSQFEQLWFDEFTGTDGTALNAHAADSGGSYGGGVGSITIASNRIVAGDAAAIRYFDPGLVNATTAIAFSLNMEAADLTGKYAELGVGVRCAASGAGQRDGYYATFRATPTLHKLRLLKSVSGTFTEVVGLGLDQLLALDGTYRLQATGAADGITVSLSDSTGAITIASFAHVPNAFAAQTAGAVIFAHHASLDVSLPWLDALRVEA